MSSVLFFDRDISWLSFNGRILSEAGKETVPLMERIRFLSIYSSNLDEFYRVRMPAIEAIEPLPVDKNTLSLYQQATSIINGQQDLYGQILHNSIIPALQQNNFHFIYNEVIPEKIAATVTDYFFTEVAGFLQPKLLTANANFFPENNQLYLAVIVHFETIEEQLYLVNIPAKDIGRFLKVTAGEQYIIFLEDIVRSHVHHLFTAAATVVACYNIKITRDAEMDLLDEYGDDLAEKMESQLSKRDLGLASRFLYEPGIPLRHLQDIIQIFNLQKAAVVQGGTYHNLKDLAQLPVDETIPSYPAWPSLNNKFALNDNTSLFEQISAADKMVHTPYQSYGMILRFFNEASIDTTVEEIYTTLYRVASDSKIVHALMSAAKNGKKVTVLIELKARFDEANNIKWAKKMKAAGVRIIYSSNAIKVHAKIALVKRNHAALPYTGLLATGNLNETTAKFYTDHILLTAHQPLLIEMEALFAFLSKRKKPDLTDNLSFKHLLVAQFNLQAKFIEMINREISNCNRGLPSSITIKINNLEEETLIKKLYEASNAGVKINLIVRSICRLVPGVRQQSENITIKRIVDRYLEHGRVFIFHNNGKEEVFIGSSDWMNRNMYHRIEVCFPLYDDAIRKQVQDIIALQWSDTVQAVLIDSDLNNVPFTDYIKPVRSQEAIYQYLSAGTTTSAK